MPTLNGVKCEIYSVSPDSAELAPCDGAFLQVFGEEVDPSARSMTALLLVESGRFGVHFDLESESTITASGARFVADIEVNGFKVAQSEEFGENSYFFGNTLKSYDHCGRVTSIEFSLHFVKIQMRHCRDLAKGEDVDESGTIAVIVRKKGESECDSSKCLVLDHEFRLQQQGTVPLEALRQNDLSHTVQLCLPIGHETKEISGELKHATQKGVPEQCQGDGSYFAKFVFKYRSAGG